MDSNFWYRGTKAVDFRSIPGIAGDIGGALKRYHLMEIDEPAQRRDQDRAFVICKVQPPHHIQYGPQTM